MRFFKVKTFLGNKTSKRGKKYYIVDTRVILMANDIPQLYTHILRQPHMLIDQVFLSPLS